MLDIWNILYSDICYMKSKITRIKYFSLRCFFNASQIDILDVLTNQWNMNTSNKSTNRKLTMTEHTHTHTHISSIQHLKDHKDHVVTTVIHALSCMPQHVWRALYDDLRFLFLVSARALWTRSHLSLYVNTTLVKVKMVTPLPRRCRGTLRAQRKIFSLPPRERA